MAEIKYLDLTGLQRYDQKIKEVINTGLDAKIGKDDVMLEGGECQNEYTKDGIRETPYVTNNWEVMADYSYAPYVSAIIYDDADNVIFELPSRTELEGDGFPVLTSKFTHENGMLSIHVSLMDAPQDYTNNISIDPNAFYKIKFGDDVWVRITGDIYANGIPANTKKSIQNLNIYKADKTELQDAINVIEDSKIGKDDILWNFRNVSVTEKLNSFETSLPLWGGRWEVYCRALDYPVDLVFSGGQSIITPNDGYNPQIKRMIEVNEFQAICENGTITISYIQDGTKVQTSTYEDQYDSYAVYIENGSVEITSKRIVDLTIPESLGYLDKFKANKVDLDTKIDNDDIMLPNIIEYDIIHETANEVDSLIHIPATDYWEVDLNVYDASGKGYELRLYDYDNDELGYTRCVISGGIGTFKLINDNGYLYGCAGTDDMRIDPSSKYVIRLEAGSQNQYGSGVVEATIYSKDSLNTKESLNYLKENKADKTEVESSLEHLNNTLSTKITAEDLPTAVSQLSNDAGYAVAGDLKIAEVTEGLGENVAKAYKFEGGAESAVIEIPKDQTLKSVELGKYATEGDAASFVVDPTGEILRFTYIIADGSEKVVDVNVSNLITEAELDPVYDLIDTKLDAADVLTVSNDEIDAMFA